MQNNTYVKAGRMELAELKSKTIAELLKIAEEKE
jgi:hypothetical protein